MDCHEGTTVLSRLSSVPRREPPVALNETAASVLGFLSIGPLTGWDLNAFAQISVGFFWNMTRSQIYRELQSLRELGLVDVEETGSRNARRFRLTAPGRKRLKQWLAEPPGEPIERKPFLVKLFFAEQMSPAERQRLMTEARAGHEAQLQTLESVVSMAEGLSPYAAATATYGIAVERAILQWFDETIAALGVSR
jgi:DNA-binding PadR family transcriptional regulator